MNTHVPAEAFKQKVLDSGRHQRLVMNIEHYASRAGISPHHIWTAARKTFGPAEIDYLEQSISRAATGVVGAYYVGENDIVSHMARMVGALVREFVDARMMTVQDIVKLDEDGEEPDATVLFIPNFYMAHEYGKYDSRKIAVLMDLLYSRAARSQPTVIHLSDKTKAIVTFGKTLPGLLTTRYEKLTAGAQHE
jgi:hypothetical protein